LLSSRKRKAEPAAMTPTNALKVGAVLMMQTLDGSRSGGHEPGSTERTPEAVEANKAKTSARDAGQVGGKETEEVVETPQDAGKELEGQRWRWPW
jgi:hypothetical protein